MEEGVLSNRVLFTTISSCFDQATISTASPIEYRFLLVGMVRDEDIRLTTIKGGGFRKVSRSAVLWLMLCRRGREKACVEVVCGGVRSSKAQRHQLLQNLGILARQQGFEST